MSDQGPIHNTHPVPSFNPEEQIISEDSQATTLLENIPKNNSPTTSTSLGTIGVIKGGRDVENLKKELSTCQDLSKNLDPRMLEAHLTTSPLTHTPISDSIKDICTKFVGNCLKKGPFSACLEKVPVKNRLK